MASTWIIFLGFVSLVQCALPSNISYGLSEDELAVLDQIRINQDAQLSGNFDGFNPAYDLIAKYIAVLIYNLENLSGDDDIAKLAVALDRIKEGNDNFLNTIPLALGVSDPAIEEIRNATYTTFEQTFAIINSALTLAATGNYSANQAQINDYQNTALDALLNIIDISYDLIPSLLNTNDENIFTIVDLAKNGSKRGTTESTHAAFNAVLTYGAAVAVGKADVRQIIEIEGYRENTLDGLTADVENGFSPLKTLYVYSKLGLPSSSLPALYANQYALTVSFYKYQDEVNAIFDTIIAYAKKIQLGLSDSGEADFSPTDAAQALAQAKLIAGSEVVLDSILTTHPGATEAVAAARETLSSSSSDLIAIIFDAIRTAGTAGTNYAESIAKIESYRKSVISYVDLYIGNYFTLIRNNETFDTDSEAQLTNIEEVAVDRLLAFANNIFEAIEILANVFHQGEATENDFSQIQTYLGLVNSALDDYTQSTAAAGIIVIKADN